MATNYMLRRRKLGKTSAREICRKSTTGIKCYRHDNLHMGRTHWYNHTAGGYFRAPLPTDAEYVFRWGCVSQVPGNPTIINTVAAIEEVNDKAAFRKKTADAGLAPKTWLSHQEYCHDQQPADGSHSSLPKKVVVRRSTHAQGRHLHVCSTLGELTIACNRYGTGNYYISELINKVAEYRVFVVSGRAIWVAKKTPGNPSQVAWNVAQGGRFDNVSWNEWPLKAVKTCIEAFNLTSLDFGGVDVMVDGDGNTYVLEINSAPSQTSEYRQSCCAKAFDYIVQHGKGRIPLVQTREGYKKFIHPAICTEALINV